MARWASLPPSRTRNNYDRMVWFHQWNFFQRGLFAIGVNAAAHS
jgi:hypothetical protein